MSPEPTLDPPSYDPPPAPALRVSVVIPTLNEAASIDALLGSLFALPELAGRLEVVVADDRSTDGTAEKVLTWARTHPVQLVQRPGKPDLAASVVAGARAARGDWVVVMDADGSHPVSMIPDLIEPLESGRADLSIGSRHVAGGSVGDWPWWRRMTSRAAACLAWPFTAVGDPMSGLFATARERLAAMPEERAGYKILLEVLVRSRPEPRVEEVPFRFTDRTEGSSKMGLATQWMFLRRLAALGGARMDLGNAARFGLVGLTGLVVDLAGFHLLLALGSGLAAAHLASFVAATVTNFTLNYRWTFAGHFHPDEPVAWRYLRFLAVALLALSMRGGVLAFLILGLGIDPGLAIFPAVVATALVNYLGAVFFVFPSAQWQPPVRVRWHLAAIGLIAYALALRLLYMGQADLVPDEMYYWVWGNLYPALSFLDHPPLVGWLTGITAPLAGDTPLGVRLSTLVLTPVAVVYIYLYGRDMIGQSAGLMAALLLVILPAYFAGGFLMTPDAPLLAAWAAALYYFQRGLVQDDRRAFLGLGLAMGLGLLSKYTMVLLAPAAAVFMLADARARRWFFRPEPWLAAALAALLFLPVLIWNWQHDWASFAFQAGRRLGGELAFSSHLILGFLLLMLAPLAGFVALYVLGPVRRVLAPDPRRRRFMLTMTLVPLAIFAVLALFAEVKFHWTVPLWLALLPLIGATMLPPDSGADRPGLARLRRLWIPAHLATLVFFGVVLHYVTLGLPGVPWQEHRLGYLGWPELAAEVSGIERELEQQTGRRPVVAGMNKWSTAAALAFHRQGEDRLNITAQNLVGMEGSQWEFWFDPDTDPQRPVILVSHEPKLIDEEWLERALIGLGPLQSRPVERRGREIQRLYYRIGEGHRPEQVRYPDRIPE